MIIEAVGLTKEFAGTQAVNGLSFTVEPGKVTGFIGRNGTGNSPPSGPCSAWSAAVAHAVRRAAIPGPAVPGTRGRCGADAKAFHPRRSAPKRLRMLAAAGHAPSAACGRVPDRRVDQVLARSAWPRWRASRPGFSLKMAQRSGLAAAVLAP